MTDLSRDTELELAALADGSLAPERREQALARARASRELRDALAEQQRAVGLTAAVKVRAPEFLHGRIESLLVPAARRRASGRRRVGFAALAATALAAGAVAIGSSVGQSPPSVLDVQQAAALTLAPATAWAPAESKIDRTQLAVTVGGVPFPYWKERFGWRSSGARSDRLAGRSITTVFYDDARGRRVGYAIASGKAPKLSAGTIVRRWGVAYRVLAREGANVVVWTRNGHLCVVSGRNVSAQTLLKLASWDSRGPRSV